MPRRTRGPEGVSRISGALRCRGERCDHARHDRAGAGARAARAAAGGAGHSDERLRRPGPAGTSARRRGAGGAHEAAGGRGACHLPRQRPRGGPWARRRLQPAVWAFSAPQILLRRVSGITKRQMRKHTAGTAIGRRRSEEHTSELQSLAYLVCRLLLEKKKKKQKTILILK